MTYEYVCTACGHQWEAEQSISAAPLKSCPSCQKEAAKRQVSGGAGFILKGGGWYSDLYSSAPKKSPSEGASSESKGDSTAKAATDGGTKGSGDGGSKGPTGSGSSGGSSSSSGGSSDSGSSGSSGSKAAGTSSAA